MRKVYREQGTHVRVRKESIVQIGYGTFILVKGDEFYAYRIVCRYYVACSYRTQCDHTIYRKITKGWNKKTECL
jgi:hypothetical protein